MRKLATAGKTEASMPKMPSLKFWRIFFSGKNISDKESGELKNIDKKDTLPETNIAPELLGLVQMSFLLGPGLLAGASLLVLGSVHKWSQHDKCNSSQAPKGQSIQATSSTTPPRPLQSLGSHWNQTMPAEKHLFSNMLMDVWGLTRLEKK